MKIQIQDQNVKTEQDALETIFKVYYSAIYKQYLVQGSDVSMICKQIKLIYDENLNQKYLYQHLLERNQRVYEIVVKYLNDTCESEGEPPNSYNNMWPTKKINSMKVQNQILDIPKVIWKRLGKDIHELYNLLLEAMYDSSLVKLYQRYNLMRQLYLIMSQVFLKAEQGTAQQQAQIQQSRKGGKKKKEGNVEKKNTLPLAFNSKKKQYRPTPWQVKQQKYLALIYNQYPIKNCIKKLNKKFGQKQKWSNSKKIFDKIEDITIRTLKTLSEDDQVKIAYFKIQSVNSTYKFLIQKMTPKVEQLLLKLHVCSTNQKRKVYFDKACTELVQLQLIQMTFPKNLFKTENTKNQNQTKIETKSREQFNPEQCKKEAQAETQNDQTIKDEIKIEVQEKSASKSKRSKNSKSAQLIECDYKEDEILF